MMMLTMILLLAASAQAQFLEGSTIARAGVIDIGFRSSSALQFNPAILGQNADQAKTAIDILSFNASAVNNAFSVNFWNDQIARDHYLTHADKTAIMDRLSNDEFRVHAGASAPLAGITYRKMGAVLSVQSAATARAPRDLFELALYGNQLNRSYNLGDFDGEEFTLMNVAVGFAYEFKQEWIPELYAGINFHFYQGLSYDKIANAAGELLITDSLITGYSVMQRVHSTSGDGVGFDLGGLAVLNEKWRLGVAFRQVGSRLTWNIEENEFKVWEADTAGVIIDSLDDDDYIERAFNSSDTTFPGGTIESDLPLLIELNGRFDAAREISLMSSLLIRTDDSGQGQKGLEAGLAAELRPRSWLPLNIGIGAGGSLGWRVGFGGGLRFKYYEMSVGWAWNRGLFDSARGVSFGLSQQFRF